MQGSSEPLVWSGARENVDQGLFEEPSLPEWELMLDAAAYLWLRVDI